MPCLRPRLFALLGASGKYPEALIPFPHLLCTYSFLSHRDVELGRFHMLCNILCFSGDNFHLLCLLCMESESHRSYSEGFATNLAVNETR